MEKLVLTSQILYDNDILEKKKENDKLKKSLENVYPKKLYISEHDWNLTLQSILENIWFFLLSSMNEDENSVIKLNYLGCPIYGSHIIANELEKNLIKISDSISWSHIKAYEIMANINSVIDALCSVDDGETIDNMMNMQKVLFIFNSIQNQLGNGFDDGYLTGIPLFKCYRCGENTDFITKKTILCFECSTIADKITQLTKLLNVTN